MNWWIIRSTSGRAETFAPIPLRASSASSSAVWSAPARGQKASDRYLAEFDFRMNTRAKLKIDDIQRTGIAVKGFAGQAADI